MREEAYRGESIGIFKEKYLMHDFFLMIRKNNPRMFKTNYSIRVHSRSFADKKQSTNGADLHEYSVPKYFIRVNSWTKTWSANDADERESYYNKEKLIIEKMVKPL